MTPNVLKTVHTDVTPITDARKSLKPANLFAWFLLCVWLTGSALFFHTFFLQDARWFAVSPSLVPDNLPVQANITRPTLIHFVDPACSCTRFSSEHIAKLEAQYPHIDHVRVFPGDRLAREFAGRHGRFWRSPAVAAVNAQGQVHYFGPYTGGAVCGKGEDLLAGSLATIEKGPSPMLIQYLHYGCYCDWPEKSSPAMAAL